MNKRSLHIISPKEGSIGEITKDLISPLRDEFNVTIEGEEEPEECDILLVHFINPAISESESFAKFKKKVLIQPIDGTDIRKMFVEEMNKYDLILTPGKGGKNLLESNGVKVPVKVIPNYYKPDIYELPLVCDIKQIPKDKFVFYHESTFHPRKGVELLYEGFIRAFSDTEYYDKVLLVCKDMPFNKLTFERIEDLKRQTIELQKQYNNPARIIKISQHVDWIVLQKLWKRADSYVSLAKIEGFGIPVLRFAVLGKPIIVLRNKNSGYMDFLSNKNSYMVPTKQKTAHNEHMNMYTKETKWAIPEIDDVIKVFRTCYQDFLSGSLKRPDENKLQRMEYPNVMKKYINLLKKV